MKIMKIQKVAAAAAVLGMLLPHSALAANTPTASQGDVALRAGGVFVGQYVDAHGNGVADAEVAMVAGGKAVAVTKTDKQGRFAVKGLQGGQYDVLAANTKNTFRCWDGKAAPPSARNGALIVAGDNVVNGQGGILGFAQTYPLLTAASVTAAIAIPVGIAAADDDPPASP